MPNKALVPPAQPLVSSGSPFEAQGQAGSASGSLRYLDGEVLDVNPPEGRAEGGGQPEGSRRRSGNDGGQRQAVAQGELGGPAAKERESWPYISLHLLPPPPRPFLHCFSTTILRTFTNNVNVNYIHGGFPLRLPLRSRFP